QLCIAWRVQFLGDRIAVPDLIAAADIYCQPSTSPESCGLTFIEALWAQLPVVTSGIGGACEIVTPRCGLLVRPSDTAALSRTLSRLITDTSLRVRLGAA